MQKSSSTKAGKKSTHYREILLLLDSSSRDGSWFLTLLYCFALLCNGSQRCSVHLSCLEKRVYIAIEWLTVLLVTATFFSAAQEKAFLPTDPQWCVVYYIYCVGLRWTALDCAVFVLVLTPVLWCVGWAMWHVILWRRGGEDTWFGVGRGAGEQKKNIK